MTYQEDPDLERRLRRIAESPEPPVPGSVFRYANEVTTRRRGFQMRSFNSAIPRRSVMLGFAGLAAVLVLAVGFTVMLRSSNNPAAESTASQSMAATASATASPVPSQTFSGTGSLPSDFVMDGADPKAAEWNGVAFGAAPGASNKWNAMPVRWKGGWVTTQTPASSSDPNIIWLSADGHGWHAVWGPDRVYPGLGGLVAFYDGKSWKSTDGVTWTYETTILNEGVVGAVGFYGSATFAGGPNGMLVQSYSLLYSSDAVTWEPVVLPGVAQPVSTPWIAWTGSRFIAVVSPNAYTSTDGRTWQRSALPGATESSDAIGLQVTDAGVLVRVRPSRTGGPADDRYVLSTDGSTWQEATVLNAILAGMPNVWVESNGDRFLAVGVDTADAMWVSLDGRNWASLSGTRYDAAALVPTLAPRGVCLTSIDVREAGGCLQYGAANP